jgi:hypothetical protein
VLIAILTKFDESFDIGCVAGDIRESRAIGKVHEFDVKSPAIGYRDQVHSELKLGQILTKQLLENIQMNLFAAIQSIAIDLRCLLEELTFSLHSPTFSLFTHIGKLIAISRVPKFGCEEWTFAESEFPGVVQQLFQCYCRRFVRQGCVGRLDPIEKQHCHDDVATEQAAVASVPMAVRAVAPQAWPANGHCHLKRPCVIAFNQLRRALEIPNKVAGRFARRSD